MEKQISVSNKFEEALGVKSITYDRGNITVLIKRDYLSSWTHCVYWYNNSFFDPNIIELHFKVADFLTALFSLNLIDFYVPKEKKEP